ncbi:MAG: nucleoside triphosphate pyrophosphohydrolase [Bacilli bacterium]|nr:nucleoside triphosphate pyrophosphohydrolase [Bacilli bacterium]
MKVYNKLVRDKIPEIMINNGAKPIFRILSDEEYLVELNKKLQEELNEYLEFGNIEELADLEEILLAILNYKNINEEEFKEIRLSKVKKRGLFNKKIFLEKEL